MSSYHSKAFVYHGHPKQVTLETLDLDCGPNDLIVKVLMCARCGTDKSIFLHGHKNVDPYAPVVLGHELIGTIVEVGNNVKNCNEGIGYAQGKKLSPDYLSFSVGERVTFQSRIARYKNGLMLIPKPIANLSFQINGGYAQYMRVPEDMIRSESVIRVPEIVSDEEACLIEPAACALESIYATPHPVGVDKEGRHIYKAGIQSGGKTCIIGSGTVSLLYVSLAILEGASKVVMVVRSEKKEKLIHQILKNQVNVYVVPQLINSTIQERLLQEEKIVHDLEEITGGYLFDDVVCACSDPNAQRLMLKLYTREGYGVGACFGGTHSLVDQVDVDQNHYRCAKTIGTSGCSTDAMKAVLQWLYEGKLSFQGFTSSRKFTFDDSPQEFFTTSADGLKPVLYPWESRL
jgi:L-iditol 2-dehydrogenase